LESAAKHFEQIAPGPSDQGASAPAEKYPLKFHGDPDDTPLKSWLLDKALPEAGVAILSGQWGTFKTFLAFDLASAVMTKASFARAGSGNLDSFPRRISVIPPVGSLEGAGCWLRRRSG